MTAQDIVAELKTLGTAQTKKTWMNHGAQEPCFGVKIGDMKKIQKRVKMDYQLALDLYDTGIADAMYLAGLIADDAKMTKKDLQKWIENATWGMVAFSIHFCKSFLVILASSAIRPAKYIASAMPVSYRSSAS